MDDAGATGARAATEGQAAVGIVGRGLQAGPYLDLVHNLAAFMEHVVYVLALVGIEHVGFGPDTVYGDHVGLHHTYAANLSLKESRGDGRPDQHFEEVDYVEGLENPTEGSHNIVRWLVREGYSDDDIERVMGGNALRVMREAWA